MMFMYHIKISIDLSNHGFPTIFVSQAFQTEFESLTSFGTLFGDALKTADTFGCVAVGHPKKKTSPKCKTSPYMCQTCFLIQVKMMGIPPNMPNAYRMFQKKDRPRWLASSSLSSTWFSCAFSLEPVLRQMMGSTRSLKLEILEDWR